MDEGKGIVSSEQDFILLLFIGSAGVSFSMWISTTVWPLTVSSSERPSLGLSVNLAIALNFFPVLTNSLGCSDSFSIFFFLLFAKRIRSAFPSIKSSSIPPYAIA